MFFFFTKKTCLSCWILSDKYCHFFQVKFDVDYSKVLSSEDKENEFEQMILSEYANLWPDVRIKSGRIEEGITKFLTMNDLKKGYLKC